MDRRAVGRLSRRASFAALRRSPYRARWGPVAAVFVPATRGETFPLVGYAIGRQCGHAVQRNRLRRRLRSAVGETAPSLAAGSYLVSSGPDAIAMPYRDLAWAVQEALVGAGEAAERDR
jgi:ribonuclease P protein component